MEELFKKLEAIKAAAKTLNGPKIQPIPALKPPPAPSMKPAAIKTKIPGVESGSKKDPKKVAEQIAQGRPSNKNPKLLKFNAGGQWSL